MGAWVNNGPTVFQNIVFFSPQQLSSQTIPEDAGSEQFHWNAMQCNAEHRTEISLFLLSSSSAITMPWHDGIAHSTAIAKHKMQSAIHPVLFSFYPL